MTIKCPNCASAIPEDTALCPECGYEHVADWPHVTMGEAYGPLGCLQTFLVVFATLLAIAGVGYIAAEKSSLIVYIIGAACVVLASALATRRLPRIMKNTQALLFVIIVIGVMTWFGAFVTCSRSMGPVW
ncbi:MAG TPA: hypothetical protein VGK19_05140 [Capsulimonadaceae bacterium]|jgi:hypothetical protein